MRQFLHEFEITIFTILGTSKKNRLYVLTICFINLNLSLKAQFGLYGNQMNLLDTKKNYLLTDTHDYVFLPIYTFPFQITVDEIKGNYRSVLDSELQKNKSNYFSDALMGTDTFLEKSTTCFPNITTQPQTQLDCEGASVTFKVVASGTSLTYVWQRKKPTDISFISIPTEGNISYPSVGEMRVNNVGSSQSPSGTQYQVVVSDTTTGCSSISDPATLLVNEITGISPSTSTVTQCYGANYSYAVATSTPYPGYVVSYQWKSSISSGIWNNVLDGEHFSGTQTATLTISNGTPAQSAEYRVYISFHSSGADCNVNSSSRSRRITFLPDYNPEIVSIIQPDCMTSSGSAVIGGLPATGNWTLYRTGSSAAIYTGTGSTTTLTGLAPGTYSFTVSNGICTSLPTSNIDINEPPVIPTAPLITAFTLPSFADNDGSISLGGLPSGNWVIHQIKDGITTTIIGSGSTYILSNLANGNYEFVAVDFCVSPKSVLVPLTTVPYIPDVSLATNINCTGFTANWPATPLATTYLLDVSSDSNFATFVSGYHNRNVGNVLSFDVSSMNLGTIYYRIRAKNATVQSIYSATMSVTLLTNSYTAGTWSLGDPPAIMGTQNLVFNSNFTANADLAGCSCTVNAGNLIVNSGKTLTIINEVVIKPSGTLTLEDSASLVQINPVQNTGIISYKRKTTAITKMDYTYWSTPVLPFTLGGVSPNTLGDKLYSYDSYVDNWKQESLTTTMQAGTGYIIRGPQDFVPPMAPANYEAIFTGNPNNGHFEVNNILADRSYLLGNPYPSALDADAFLEANQDVLDGTLYFWTHNTPIVIGTPDPNTGRYTYSGDDYASYNATGAVSAAVSNPTNNKTTNIETSPTGKIASGQGFFGSSKLELPNQPKIIYDNSMRVGVGNLSGTNSQFFKCNTNTLPEKKRFWLNLTNEYGAFKQTLVGYISDATNEFENRFDGESYDGNDFLDFYSILQDKNLTIQGRALPFNAKDQVFLGFRVAVGGVFTIKIHQIEGFLNNQEIFLVDQFTQKTTNLNMESYTFTTDSGAFDDRFMLKYIKEETLNIEDKVNVDSLTVIYDSKLKSILLLNYGNEAIHSVFLYNITGQNIAKWKQKEQVQFFIQIPIKGIASQIGIVKINTNKGTITKKVIIH